MPEAGTYKKDHLHPHVWETHHLTEKNHIKQTHQVLCQMPRAVRVRAVFMPTRKNVGSWEARGFKRRAVSTY